MPLNGFTSLCSKNAKQIVSRDKGNPQYHKANNVSNSEVTHYQIDGKVIKTGDRCDYLLMNETSKTAYLIELKGSDLVKAASQLEATENALRSQLVLRINVKHRKYIPVRIGNIRYDGRVGYYRKRDILKKKSRK